MADAGIEDILVGYPIVGEQKLARLVDLAERVAITVTVDSDEVAAGIARAARERGLTIRALLELDTGMRRLGVLPGPGAVDLAERIAALDGLELAGVFTHEGHVYTQARDDAERERMTLECCRLAVETAEEIRAPRARRRRSSRSARRARSASRSAARGVTEVRPGHVRLQRPQPDRAGRLRAATTSPRSSVATVVSRPAPDRIVVDAGSKVLTSDRMLVPDPPASFGWVWGHDDWDVVRLSEEHGVVERAAGRGRADRRSRRDRPEPRLPDDQPRERRDRRRGRTRRRPLAGRGARPRPVALSPRPRPPRASPPACARGRASPLRRSLNGFCGAGQIGCCAHGAGRLRRAAARAACRRRSSACSRAAGAPRASRPRCRRAGTAPPAGGRARCPRASPGRSVPDVGRARGCSAGRDVVARDDLRQRHAEVEELAHGTSAGRRRGR